MFKKSLILAGLLSLVSISAQANDRVIINADNNNLEGLSDVTTTEAGGRGGAVQNAAGHNLTVHGTFSNNSINAQNEGEITLGGAIFQQGGTLTVNDGTTFSNNKANGHEQSYPDYPQNDYPSGGAITQMGGTFTGEGKVTFSGNVAGENSENSTGGAIYFGGHTDATFENAKFENNKSGLYGGAIYADSSKVTINGTGEFTGNKSWHGGAVMIFGDSDSTSFKTGANSKFSENKAGGNGGAIANYYGTVEIGENSTFSGNTAAKNGGAIYNDATTDSDAPQLDYTGKTTVNAGTTFTGNKAAQGGAIYNAGKLTINDGVTFENNSATQQGGAIFTQGDLTIQAENKDVTFSGNTATSGGADVYLSGGNMTIKTSEGHKVIFGSNDSIAGSGNITNEGTVEFSGNHTVNNYTGTYTQTGENTKTTLNNSDMFNKFDIQSGELELKDGGKATIGENKKFSGKKLTVTGDGSVLTLDDADKVSTIDENVVVNIGQGAEVDIINGQLTLNAQAPASAYSLFALTSGDETFDTWNGSVHVGNGEGSKGELVLDGFSHNTTDGTYLQDGGKLTLQNGSNLTLNDEGSSISGGDVAVESGTTLGVQGGANVSGGNFDVDGDINIGSNGTVSGSADMDISGNLNVNQGGTVSGGTFDVESGGHFDVEQGGSVSNGTFNVQGEMDVKSGGTVTGGTVDVKSGGTLDVEGTVNGNTQLTLESGSTTNVTENGDLTVKNGSTWQGDVNNNGGTVTVDGLASKSGKYTQTGEANLNVKGEETNFELQDGDTITGGNIEVSEGGTVDVNGGSVSNSDINVSGGTLDVKSGTVSGSDIDVNGGGTLNVEGGTVSDSNIDVSGEGSTLAVGGDSAGSITGGTIDISDGADLAVENQGSISGNAQITADGGSIDVKEGGTIEGGNITAQNGGSLNVDDGGTIEDGHISVEGAAFDVKQGGTVSGGDITLGQGSSFNVEEGGSVSGGDFHFSGKMEGDIKIQDDIAEAAGYNIEGGNNYLITGEGNLTVNGDGEHADNWNSDSTIQLGKSRESNDGGTLTFEGTKNGSNGVLHANNGSLNVKGGEQALDIGEGSYVYKEVKTNVENGSTLNVTEGNVTLDGDEGSADTWNGKVKVSGGNLTLEDMKSKSGTFEQTAGSTTVKGEFDMNQESDSITGGSVTIGDGSTTSTLDQSNGIISDGASVDIKEHGALQMSGGTTTLNEGDTWAGNVEVSESGNLTVDGFSGDNAKSGALKQSGGKLTVTSDFDVNNSEDKIEEGAQVVLSDNVTLNISDGDVTLDGDDEHADTWGNAHVDLTNGTLTLDNITNDSSTSKARAEEAYHGRLTATGGTLNITNGSDLVLQDGDTIGSGTNAKLESGNKLTINDGGSAWFDKEGDTWAGDITLNEGGTLNYGGTSNGKLTAVAGDLTTTAESTLSVTSGSTIEDAVNAQIQGELSIGDTSNGAGTVSLNDGDTVLGDITINSQGVLNMGNGVRMKDHQEGEENQKITFNGADSTLNLDGDHAENSGLNLKADLVSTNDKDGHINKNGSGDVLFSGSTSKYSGNLTLHKSGNLYFDDRDGFGGSLEFGDDIAGEHIGIYSDKFQGTTKLDKAATLTYSTRHGDVDLVISDDIEVSNGGTINAFAQNGRSVTLEEVKAHDEGTVNASGVDVTIDKDITVNNKSTVNAYAKNEVSVKDGISADNESNVNISGTSVESNGITAKNHSNVNIAASEPSNLGKVTLEDSRLGVAGTGYKADSTTFKGESSVSLVDGILTDSSTGNIIFTETPSTGSFGIDISGRDWKSDRILTGSVSGGGTINVDNWDFINKCPIDRDVYLQVFEGQGLDAVNFTATNKEVFTPIGDYRLFSNGGGNYRASLVRYNDQVFRGQVSTIANFQNQLTINNMLFNHTQEINMQYLAQHNPNRYAAAFPQFAPYQYDKKDGSLWFKPFGTFERLDLGRNLDVENNFYGALIGGDFPAVELKKGWTLLPTAYIGYTGAHQNYANTSMYQNGGQGGLMATFMKNDFIGSVLAYGGGYGNEMDVTGLYNYAGSYNDKAGNWYVGAAVKTAYNFHPGKHFVIQPSLLASYSLFGKQGWHTDYGDMHMRSGYLNGVNVAPGINFIYGRETWSTYLTVQYFFNIMSSVDGQAGNVDLHRLGMDHGFLEYGFGITKTWKDRLSGYFQMVIRNVGRTGVGFQGGLMFKL